MKAIPLSIPEVMLLQPTVFADERGYFYESYHLEKFEAATGVKTTFVQDNHSYSTQGVLRGLHYQIAPYAQGKLVRVLVGEIFDVAVDIRADSPTFGHFVSANLSAHNKRQLWIPPGFAHGFLTLSEHAEVLYKTTQLYSPKHERILRWNDPALNINWPAIAPVLLSDKDQSAYTLTHLNAEIL